MDPDNGVLAPISPPRAEQLRSLHVPGVFHVGGVLEIDGSRFEITGISLKWMMLRISSSFEVPRG